MTKRQKPQLHPTPAFDRFPPFVIGCALFLLAPDVYAGSATGALATILQEIARWVDAISGPFLAAFSILAIVVACFVLMFMRIGSGAQWIIRGVIAILIAANAADIVGDLGATGGTF